MKKNLHYLTIFIMAIAMAACGGKTEETGPITIDPSVLAKARVAMHDNSLCADDPQMAGVTIDKFRLNEITIENAQLTTFPDPLGPTENPGGQLADYCWWVMGRDCPTTWYGDQQVAFESTDEMASAAETSVSGDRCRTWLESDVGIDLDNVVAVSMFQMEYRQIGYNAFGDETYPTYYCLVPRDLLGDVERADVTSCRMKVLGVTESGASNIVFGYATELKLAS